jgi:hypothetical protein
MTGQFLFPRKDRAAPGHLRAGFELERNEDDVELEDTFETLNEWWNLAGEEVDIAEDD